MYKYVLYNDLESEKEKLFNQKCFSFLGPHCFDMISSTLNLTDNIFKSEILTTDDINCILLKKYCISNHEKNDITTMIDTYLEVNNISLIDNLMNKVPRIKEDLLKVYIENIITSNHDLIIKKADEIGYEKLSRTLSNIEQYYIDKNTTIVNKQMIKKS